MPNDKTMARSIAKRLGVTEDNAKDNIRQERSVANMLSSLKRRIEGQGRDEELREKNREMEREVRRKLLHEMAGKKEEEIMQDDEMLPEEKDERLTELLESGVPVDPDNIGRRREAQEMLKRVLSDRLGRIRSRGIAGEESE